MMNHNLPWRTHLGFPVQVVSRTILKDQLSETEVESKYCYHHGHYSGTDLRVPRLAGWTYLRYIGM